MFISLNPPAAMLERLGEWQRELRASLPDGRLRWAAPEQVHLTLRFLGNVPRECLDALRTALEGACGEVPPFIVRIEGCGCFPDARRPRVLWVGLTGDLETLRDLHCRVAAATMDVGERERAGEFQPHLTIARLKDAAPRDAVAVAGVLMAAGRLALGEWRVDSCELMESIQSPQGARHQRLASVSLGVPR